MVAITFVSAKSTTAINVPTRVETKITTKVSFIASWRLGQITLESSTLTSFRNLAGLTLAMFEIVA